MNKNYMVQIDGLRLIAVASVMFSHWVNIEQLKFVNGIGGSCGVNLFFVLSGFLITGILIKNKLNTNYSRKFLLKQFYIRRFLRIFPLYYLILFIGVVFSIPDAAEYFGWFVTYTFNFISGWLKGVGHYYGHLWSLDVEEQFYIFFPFLILLFPVKHYIKLFVTLIIIAFAARLFPFLLFADIGKAEMIAYAFTPACFDSFALGAILAYLSIFEKDKLKTILNKVPFFIGCLLLSFTLVSYQVYYPNVVSSVTARFLFSLFSFWLIGRASGREFAGAFGKFLENRTVVYLGKITYGLYVYHHFMPYLFSRLLGTTDSGPVKLLYPLATVLIATLSWQFFEKPINKLKDRFEYL